MLQIEKDFVKEYNITVYTLKLDDGQSLTIHEGEFETLKNYITENLAPASKTITLKFNDDIDLEKLEENLNNELGNNYIKVTTEGETVRIETEIDFNYDTLDEVLYALDEEYTDYNVVNVKFNY